MKFYQLLSGTCGFGLLTRNWKFYSASDLDGTIRVRRMAEIQGIDRGTMSNVSMIMFQSYTFICKRNFFTSHLLVYVCMYLCDEFLWG